MPGASPTDLPMVAEVNYSVPTAGLAPSHHVLAPAPGTSLSSYLPHWDPQPTSSSESKTFNNSSSNSNTQELDHDDYNRPINLTCLPDSTALLDRNNVVRIGFRNPWPSWHKPTVTQVWRGLEWGEDHDPSIDYALLDADIGTSSDADAHHVDDSVSPYKDSRPPSPVQNQDECSEHQQTSIAQLPFNFDRKTIPAATYTRSQRIKMAAKQLLTIEEPDFTFDSAKVEKLKATWLGHAGVLLQLPPLSHNQQPIRVLFDPIFSQRCSPTQVAGPIRSYAAPCQISSLPPINLVVISHNHYDHLDYDTIKELWAANKDRIRFVVPLGNKDWFVAGNIADAQASLQPSSTTASSSTWSLAPSITNVAATSNLSIPPERVTELDWWDEVHLTQPGSADKLRVICTPAQHGSGRYGVDANCALWSSWFLEHPGTKSDSNPCKIFFGGDTGCQFHGRSFPPSPRPAEGGVSAGAILSSETGSIGDNDTLPDSSQTSTYHGGLRLPQEEEEQYPACPAFEEIVSRLGTPTFLMLPISVGATISFLRSYVPLPDSISPFPRISSGLTAANHMPPWDAVSVFDRMTKDIEAGEGWKNGKQERGNVVCMAIHWGTFISGPEEVLKTLGQLKFACQQHAVKFARSQDELRSDAIPKEKKKSGTTAPTKSFVALNHGASLTL
ncbi:related to FMP30 - mitochondrial inner membrane protein with a role in maintaining mitochondrial morphology [Melanopsichium pennsylvanicum]|uniref:Related to FMP30 - mitochondrial inner membrane protein with a role in maintaining mitochondrial morphology n=2 Tax=Melanopsichium pennsylvanicum TaxID=63383 RepID=A0AAJ5C4P1_9BASI|nr:n-acyl-phosphatidylethanolamine-hydrolyzing phospholipase d [Melanopsichium pennsylvanicum 4]SNX83881.1 related to FMP30 - mitochondrial inner membrane protein with a role in maintaining mitochondrial morphology [Melanopsichium pennsylvanicum]